MYRIGDTIYGPDDEAIIDALASAHSNGVRPLCMCKPAGVEMYIAKVNTKFIVKRMPDTGPMHAPSCDSYEPPAELSGRGEVMGAAIDTDMGEGITTLKFDFALTKTGSRSAPVKGEGEHDSVRTDGKKLTLRSTLHYLYEEAGFTRWSPAMAGKRSWWVIRKYLLEAAADKKAKGLALTDMLYIPESFVTDRKDEIALRRHAQFRAIMPSGGSTRRLMLLIGELKDIGDARFGKKMVIKHAADCPFILSEDIYKRFLKRFGNELTICDGNEAAHLLVIATFSVNSSGTAIIEEASTMLVDSNWIPFENVDERLLIDQLIKQKRKFVKGLRYNLPSNKVLACAVLNDTVEPVAIYILPYGADDQLKKEIVELQESSNMMSVVWDTSKEIPQLPAPRC